MASSGSVFPTCRCLLWDHFWRFHILLHVPSKFICLFLHSPFIPSFTPAYFLLFPSPPASKFELEILLRTQMSCFSKMHLIPQLPLKLLRAVTSNTKHTCSSHLFILISYFTKKELAFLGKVPKHNSNVRTIQRSLGHIILNFKEGIKSSSHWYKRRQY